MLLWSACQTKNVSDRKKSIQAIVQLSKGDISSKHINPLSSSNLKNYYKLIYSDFCSGHCQQCGFFHWADEPEPFDDRHTNELDLIRNVCIHLTERFEEIEEEHEDEKAEWEREKAELTLKLSALQTQLDDIHNRIRMTNESFSMPPLSIRDDEDEDDDALVIYNL